LSTELLAVCISTLRKQGLSARRISQLAESAIKYQGDIPVTTKLFQDVSDLGLLVSDWTDNAEYVDSLGRPKVLPIAGGPPSFHSLVTKYFYGRSVTEILQLGYRTQVFEPVGRNKVAHLGPCVLLTGDPLMLLAHAVRSIRWFLGAANNNSLARQATLATWPERQAFTELSLRDFDDFVSFMRNPIINLTEMANRWLMARSAIKDKGSRVKGKKVVMGMQAYVFRDA
jgi:hypothetical protein